MLQRFAVLPIIAVLAGLIASCSPFGSDLDPEAPAPAPSELPPLPVRTSSFRLPVSVPISTLETLLEEVVPKSTSGSRSDVLWEIDIDRWRAARGSIALSGTTDGALDLRTDVQGAVTFGLDVPGSDFLPGVEDLSATIEMRGLLSGTAKPALEPGWRVRPNLSGSVVLREAVHELFNRWEVSLRSVVQPEVNKEVRKKLRSLNRSISNNDYLETAARTAWAALCESVVLPLEPPHWLEVRPVEASAVQPRVDGASVHFLFGLEAETRIVPVAPVEGECEFPEKLVLEDSSDGLSEIALPVEVSYEALQSALLGAVRGRTVGERVRVSVSDLRLRPYGRSLLLEVDLSARVGGWTGARGRGTLYLAAEPMLVAEEQVVRLSNLRLDTASRNVLVAALGESVEPVLLALFEGQKVLELDPAWSDLLEKANGALAELATEEVGVDGTLEDIRLIRLDVGPEALRAVVLATGRIRVAVEASLQEL